MGNPEAPNVQSAASSSSPPIITDDQSAGSVRVRLEEREHVNEAAADDGIASNPDAADHPDVARQVDAVGHDADLGPTRRDERGTVGPDEPDDHGQVDGDDLIRTIHRENLRLHNDRRACPFGWSARPRRHRYYFPASVRYPTGGQPRLSEQLLRFPKLFHRGFG